MDTEKRPVFLKIEFVTDIANAWCVIHLHTLDRALRTLRNEVSAELSFQPFQLARELGPAGATLAELLRDRQGWTPAQVEQNETVAQAHAGAVGVAYTSDPHRRIWNTFDAHRLMRWAAMQHAERALYLALADAAFAHGDNLSDHGTLAGIAARAGLDASAAREMLAGDRFAAEVRTREAHYREHQVFQVPTLVINGRHRVNGALPHDETVAGLRRIAALPT